MKLVYMVQTEGALPPLFEALRTEPNVTLLHLSFKDAVEGAIFLPNSTWTEGRNALLAQARELSGDFDYYVFCDDDIDFEKGSFDSFHRQLDELRPAIATPLYDFAPNKHPDLSAHTIYAFDAMMNAFHRDIIEDGVILPYYTGFDKLSWWFSQFFVIHISSVLYPDHVLRLSDTWIRGLQHRPYPRNTREQWVEAEDYLFSEVFADQDFLKDKFRHHYHKASEVPRLPVTAAQSYRLETWQKDKLKLSGEFWFTAQRHAQ